MATDRRAAKRKLEKMLLYLHGHRNALEAYRKKGNVAGVEQCKRVLKIDHRRIREHCAEHGLELPHDVPPEDAA